MAGIVLENLRKVYPQPRGKSVLALDGMSLEVGDGELLVLAGPSGCGKTTTLRLIAGLEEATGGTIRIGQRVMNGVPPQDRDVAMVFQNHALFPHLTAHENMALGLRLRKVEPAEIDRRVREAAELLGIGELLERRPQALSGGQRQRVAVGRAIVRRPEVFLFDEPLASLDAGLRVQLRMELAGLHRRLGATLVYVTHDQAEAMTLGDRVAVMGRGVVQQVGGPMEVYRRPANLFVAGFLGMPPMNLLPCEWVERDGCIVILDDRGDRVRFPLPTEWGPRLRSHDEGAIVFGIRPEHVTLTGVTESRRGGSCEGRVEWAEALGAETLVHVRTTAGAVIARRQAGGPWSAGERVEVGFDLEQAHFFDARSGQRIG